MKRENERVGGAKRIRKKGEEEEGRGERERWEGKRGESVCVRERVCVHVCERERWGKREEEVEDMEK